jgi:hypothetical protein
MTDKPKSSDLILHRNTPKEGLREKGTPLFQWWSGHLSVVAFHVHNNTPDSHWQYIINGAKSIKSTTPYPTKDACVAALSASLKHIAVGLVEAADSLSGEK